MRLLIASLLLVGCKASDDYPVGPKGGLDSGLHDTPVDIPVDAAAPPDAAAACIADATATPQPTGPTLVHIDFAASAGDGVALVLDPRAPPAVIAGPLRITTPRADTMIPMTATMGVVAVFVGDNGGATCQALIMFN